MIRVIRLNIELIYGEELTLDEIRDCILDDLADALKQNKLEDIATVTYE